MLTAAVVLFILFFLLIIPVEAEFRFKNLSGNEKTVKVRAFFGLISKTVYPSFQSENQKNKEKTFNKNKKENKSGNEFSKIIGVNNNTAIERMIFDFVMQLPPIVNCVLLQRLYHL